MTLRLASLSLLVLGTLAFAACDQATIANGNGGGGSGGSNSSSSSSSGSSTSSSGSSGNACTAAGGTCVAVTPDACMNGVWDSSMSCGTGVGVGCCLPKSGCGDTCGTLGATRCIDNIVETCDYNPQTDCLPVWMNATSCPLDQQCNATATACVPSNADTCSTDAQCGCGCFCDNGSCTCAGTSWFGGSCTVEDDCGPSCVGASCLGGSCVKPCAPGADQTCNADPAQSSLAGHCNADQTCTCNSGFTKQENGLCK